MHHPAAAAQRKVRAGGKYSAYTYAVALFVSVVALILLSYFSHATVGAPTAELTEPAAVQTEIRA